MTTLKDVAKAAGLSVSAVSYALRGAPNIPPATVERVRRVAEQLGYRPQPRVAELMAHIRRGRPVAAGERLAFLWMDAPWKKRAFHTLWAGARERAAELGFGMEEFWLKESGMTPERLHGILRARGIRGLVLSPLVGADHFELPWDWSPFCAVILGNAAGNPELHRAGHHHFSAMREAVHHFREAGHRRMAALLPRSVDERAKRAWSGAFLAHRPLPASARRWLWVADGVVPKAVARWWRKLSPGALITTQTFLPALPPGARKRPLLVLDWTPSAGGLPGIDQMEASIAAHAVDLVVARLQRNEGGVPAVPTQLLLPGRLV